MTDARVMPREQIRILIVEDDPLQAQALAETLLGQGFEADTVSDGLAAVWKTREGRYDVVLLDYQLPEIDGYAVARLVNDLMGGAARPILIALTAAPEQLDARESGQASVFNAIIAKSSGFSGLCSTIVRCLTSAPEPAARQEALFAVLEKAWSDYDTPPTRPWLDGDDPGRARILVVDDDAAQRLLLTSVLEPRGYAVEVASDGLEAVRRIRSEGFDLALIDYDMPEVDGLAAGMLVRDLIGEDVRPRMIGLTATASGLSQREGIPRSVFDEIIQKPFDLAQLLSAVDRHMRVSPNPITRQAATWISA